MSDQWIRRNYLDYCAFINCRIVWEEHAVAQSSAIKVPYLNSNPALLDNGNISRGRHSTVAKRKPQLLTFNPHFISINYYFFRQSIARCRSYQSYPATRFLWKFEHDYSSESYDLHSIGSHMEEKKTAIQRCSYWSVNWENVQKPNVHPSSIMPPLWSLEAGSSSGSLPTTTGYSLGSFRVSNSSRYDFSHGKVKLWKYYT